MNLFDLTGKKALVTGGTRGLGYSMAEALLEAGAEAAIVGVSDGVAAAAQRLTDATQQRTVPIQADLGDRAQLTEAFDRAVGALGTLDILLVNHGIQRRDPAEDFTIEDWDAVIEVNLSSMFLLNQLAGRVMLAGGYGKIINVASVLTFSGGINVPAYAAAKGGVGQLTKALSNEWAGRGVNVNAIAPGYMDTDMTSALVNDADRNAGILARIPAQRWGNSADLKGAAVFLASAASDYVNGILLPVDGGWLGR